MIRLGLGLLILTLGRAEATAESVRHDSVTVTDEESSPLLIPAENADGLPVAVAGGGDVYLLNLEDRGSELSVTAVRQGEVVSSGTTRIPDVGGREEWFIDNQRFLGAYVDRGDLNLGFLAEGCVFR